MINFVACMCVFVRALNADECERSGAALQRLDSYASLWPRSVFCFVFPMVFDTLDFIPYLLSAQ